MNRTTLVLGLLLLINYFCDFYVEAAHAAPDEMYAVDEVDKIKFLGAVESGDRVKVVFTLGAILPIESRVHFVKNTKYSRGPFCGHNALHRAVWEGNLSMVRLLLLIIPAGPEMDKLLGQTFYDGSTLIDVAKKWHQHLVPILEGGFSFARR